MEQSKVKFKEQLIAFLVCWTFFTILYNSSAYYISKLDVVSSFTFSFEKYIPFVDWTLIPYASSPILFVVVFFITKNKNELFLLSKRVFFVTTISCICFILFPLKFSLEKPESSSFLLNNIILYISKMDNSFNQAPSLHVSFACIYWSVLSKRLHGIFKIGAGIWIILIIVSTLTVYQHHLIDVLTAFVLIGITFLVFPSDIKKRIIKRI